MEKAPRVMIAFTYNAYAHTHVVVITKSKDYVYGMWVYRYLVCEKVIIE